MKARVLGLFLSLGLFACQGETKEIDLGFQGEALRNPLLAAERFTTAMGLPARSFATYPGLPPQDILLVVTPTAINWEGVQGEELRNWIEGGGTVILLIEQERATWQTLLGESGWQTGDGPDPPPPTQQARGWLGWLGLEKCPAPTPLKSHFQTEDGRVFRLTGLAGQALRDVRGDAGPPLIGTPEAAHLLTVERGLGRVLVFSGPEWLHNGNISRRDNAPFLWLILQSSRVTGAWYVHRSRPPLWYLIWDRAWMVVVAAAGALALWLWRRGRRFGPLLADPPPGRRDFSEHVVASGHFLWRQHAADTLLWASRNRFQLRLAQVAPELAALDPEQTAIELAQRSGLPPERCRAALFEAPRRDAAFFTHAVRDLKRMHRSL